MNSWIKLAKPKLMALKIIDHGSAEYQQMVKMRTEILRKPIGIHFSESELDSEKDNLLIGAFEEEQMLGCCMLVEQDRSTVRLRQIAVIDNLQGKGIGRAITLFAENLARDRGYKTITMHARKNVVGFFQKLGYKVVGDEFIEITIPHVIMQKEL